MTRQRSARPLAWWAASCVSGDAGAGASPRAGLRGQGRAKALRLFALGHSRNAVARKLGVERAQVHAAVASATASGTLPAVRARLAARIEALLEDVVAHKERAPQKLTGYEFGVLYDRYALLRGEATQRIEVTTVSDERQALERELLAFVRGKPAVPASPPALPKETKS